MDIYGRPIEGGGGSSLDDGGTINGDLDVVGDIDCVNLTVTDTATISTLITQQELEVIDPLITVGVGNPADLSNLGVLDEHKDGSQVWGGLIRSKDNGNYYLLRDQPVKPLPSSNITTANRAELGTVHVNQLNASVIDSDGFVRANSGLVMNQNTDSWLIKPDIGLNGQVLTFDASDDTAKWAAAGGGGSQDLQQTYDLSTSPMISSTAANPTLVLRQTAAGGSSLLELQNITGAKRMALSSDGNLAISGSNSSVTLQTSSGDDAWTIQNDGGTDSLKITTANFGDAISITPGGLISFNNSLDEYRFPSSRGTDGQVLTAQLSGAAIGWETPSASSSTLQEAFDLSSSPQILTDVTNSEMVVKSHTTNASAFSVLDSSNGAVFNVNASGTCSMGTLLADSVSVLDVQLKNNLNVDRFSIEHEEAIDALSVKNSLSTDLQVTAQDGSTTWKVNGNDSMLLTDDGNLGIGFDPGSHVFATFKQAFPALMSCTTASNSASHRSMLFLKRSKGTLASPSAISSGDWISNVISQGHDGVDFGTCADILVLASETWSPGNHGVDMRFTTTKNGEDSITERMRITSEGLICIGNPAAGSVYYMPPATGSAGQTLRLDGSDQLVFESIIPATSTDNSISRFDGTAGLLQDSGWTIDDSDNLTDGTSSFTGSSGLATTECHVDSVYLKDGIGVDQFSISRQGANTLNIRNALGVDTIIIGQSGTSQFNIGGVTECIIDSTGLHMQNNDIQAVANLTCADILYSVPFFHGYFYGNHPLTLVTQNVWQQVFLGGNFTPGADNTNFSFNSNGVATYTGSRDRRCEVTSTFSIGIDPTQAGAQFEVFVSVGIPADLTLDNANGSQCLMFMGGNDNEVHTGSSHFYPKLTNLDTLRMYARCTTSANALIQMRAQSFIGTCISNVIP